MNVEALGFARRLLALHLALVHSQVAGLFVPLCHSSVPLAQRHGLRTAEDRLA